MLQLNPPKPHTKLAKHSLGSAVATFISRITGFMRDILTANLFGATVGYDAFILAFRIPNLLRRLFAEGAFSQAFVPIFAEYSQKSSKNELKAFVNNIVGNLTLILLLVTSLGILLAPYVIKLFAPGFEQLTTEQVVPNKLSIATSMLQIVFPYILFISLTALAAGILNCYQQFIIPAFTPVLLNLSLIGCGWFLSNQLVPAEYSLAWGVLLAGVLQLGLQLPFLYKLNLLPKPKINWQDPGVKRLLIRMVPAILGAAIGQINILVDSIFASFLITGSISWLYYADRLMEFPLGIFGVSFATVILPQLSRSYLNHDLQQFNTVLTWGIRSAFLVGVPATLALWLLAKPIVGGLFLTGKFTNYDVLNCSLALQGYAVAVLGIMLAKILASGFYAIGDLKTPVKLGGLVLVANVGLNSILIPRLAHVGIALATSIVSVLHAGILYFSLRKKGINLIGLGKFSGQLSLAGGGLGIFWYIYASKAEVWLSWAMPCKIIKLVGILGLGGILYFGILWLSGFSIKNIMQ